MQGGFAAVSMSIGVIAVFLLTGGGVRLIRSGQRRKAALMIAAALVLLLNLLIWAMPI